MQPWTPSSVASLSLAALLSAKRGGITRNTLLDEQGRHGLLEGGEDGGSKPLLQLVIEPSRDLQVLDDLGELLDERLRKEPSASRWIAPVDHKGRPRK